MTCGAPSISLMFPPQPDKPALSGPAHSESSIYSWALFLSADEGVSPEGFEEKS